MRQRNRVVVLTALGLGVLALASSGLNAGGDDNGRDDNGRPFGRRAKNVILFIGDGMGVSTVTATRVFSVGVAGELAMDRFPYTALSRTYSSDSITADSAPTMTAMMTGHNTNGGVIGLDEKTEVRDFNRDGNGILDLVYDVDPASGAVSPSTDRNGVPYTTLVYGNGPGYRGRPRVDPRMDVFPGRGGVIPNGPAHQAYFQEAAVPTGSETHSGEEVAIYAIGPGAEMVRGTVKNTFIYHVMAKALGIVPRH